MPGSGNAKTMTPRELNARNDVEILDVREPDEWHAGHIDGSVHIPMREIVARAGEFDRDRPIVTVCRSGQRSGQVAAFLSQQQYDATNLDGGLQAWAQEGLPLATPSGAPGQVI